MFSLLEPIISAQKMVLLSLVLIYVCKLVYKHVIVVSENR